MLYGTKEKTNDAARWKIFDRKHHRENKIIDMSSLPPCTTVLHLHAKRANAVAYLWRNSVNPTIEFPSLEQNGWFITGDIQWVEEVFPDMIEELLNEESDEDDDYDCGSDINTDEESCGEDD